jgi:hypothetical protein
MGRGLAGTSLELLRATCYEGFLAGLKQDPNYVNDYYQHGLMCYKHFKWYVRDGCIDYTAGFDGITGRMAALDSVAPFKETTF